MCGHPDPFRSVRDLGRVPARCSWPSGIPEGRSPRWLPAWLPVSEGPGRPVRPPRTVRFSGRTYAQLARIVRALCACRRSLPLAVGCCCCCHRCCQLSTGAAVASRAAPCRGWPASGPGRLRPGPWSLTGVRRGSGVKRDVACTFIRHLSPVLVVPRSLSRLRLEERTRTLSGPSPDPSPARTVAPSRSRGRGPGVHRQSPVRAAISAVSGTPRGLLLRRAPALPRRRSGRPC
jgi:hypothetical protein